MIIVDEKKYWEMKNAFFKKYPILKIDTSSMDEYGNYHKTYLCEKNQQWYESYTHEETDIEVKTIYRKLEIKGTITAKLFRTEFWNTGDGCSYLMYERE